MGYLIAYLLLALAFDLLRELLTPDISSRNSAVRRRLWSESEFDCCSNVFAVEEAARLHSASPASVQPFKVKKRRRSWLASPWKAQNFV